VEHIYMFILFITTEVISTRVSALFFSLSCTVPQPQRLAEEKRCSAVIVAIVLNHKCHKKHVSTIFFLIFFWRVHNACTVYSVGNFLL